MIERVRIGAGATPRHQVTSGGAYFAGPKTNVPTFSSGCKMLDLALGGGWAERRISNVIGDRSTGKTLIAIEASANFILKYPRGKVLYREAESAFDESYAGSLGMPLTNVDFGVPVETVEDMFEDLDDVCKKQSEVFYVCDSLDALSDREEMKRDIDEGSYRTGKSKMLSEMFRRITSQMANAHVTLMIISQVRDNIGVMMGPKTKRSGGRALDFYSSQTIMLSQIEILKRTVGGISRATGINVRAKCIKNKISMPYREALFDITFGYGIDDLVACVDFLVEVKDTDDLGFKAADKSGLAKYISKAAKLDNAEYKKELGFVRKLAEYHWYEIEKRMFPTRSKYGSRE